MIHHPPIPEESRRLLRGGRGAVGLVVLLAALGCARRESADARTWVVLPAEESWRLSTHPALPVDAARLRSRLAEALERTGRFRVPPGPLPAAEDRLAAHASLVVTDASVLADPEPARAVRLRLEFLPPLAPEGRRLHIDAAARGPADPSHAGRLVEQALASALNRLVARLDLRHRPDAELLELLSSEGELAGAATDELVARRHPGAFAPLLEALTGGDEERARAALGALVILHDGRAVRPIIDQAQERGLDFLLEALFALGVLGGERAEAFLSTLDGGHYDPRVRQAAAEALELAARRSAALPETSR